MNRTTLKKPSLSVCIPAYNEAANIGYLLRALQSQHQTEFLLKDVTVYLDGCSDKTGSIVKKLQKSFPEIRLVDDPVRQGKVSRLNQIFINNTSDVLIVLDADIGLVGHDFLDRLASRLFSDKQALMVAAHQKPVKPENGMGKIIYTSFVLWDNIRLSLPDQDHVHNFYGAATAYRGSFAKGLHIPDGLSEERMYLFLSAHIHGGFRYCREAVITYFAPATLAEFIGLARRSFGKPQPILEKLFGQEALQAYSVPLKTSWQV